MYLERLTGFSKLKGRGPTETHGPTSERASKIYLVAFSSFFFFSRALAPIHPHSRVFFASSLTRLVLASRQIQMSRRKIRMKIARV